jgi:hypothetical protein
MASDPGHPYVAGLAAGTDTGKPRWDLSLADDGQALPAVIDGPVVVVAEADGTVEGVGTLDGRLRWSNLVPAGCIPATEGNASLNPGAHGVPAGWRPAGGCQLGWGMAATIRPIGSTNTLGSWFRPSGAASRIDWGRGQR